ncbi:FAD-dependent oxidoreductase [Glaciihabitans sp. dw_435]|uniref:FAD-dependent oxidoreductase n=1 Tax=Glaciihabitans sp. dw_435 TaxID=2720081 RepID=UPI001BD58E98|nr:FAD-dependent oxidoreductase [Glaciihabitans sp. dw_435]
MSAISAPTTSAAGFSARQWLDRVTGRVTMYRLVVICLLALLVEALILGATGQLFYTAPAILASAVVAVGVTWLTGIGFALLFRTRAHPESSIITGLLILFLFQPSLETADLWTLALAALIASASKYLLAIRRRHIFNPAALAALVMTLLQLNFVTWWVATGWMLPLTALTAFLVLYRTRRITVALVYIVVAAAIVISYGVSNGVEFGTAVSTAFLSYPIVFFAGFMLSEPLTLPPRRWQQLALAAIVAVIASVPFNFPPFYNTPQLALVVGNLLAFAVGQRRGIRLDFLGRRALTPTSWEFEFRPQRPLAFSAGQFMEITLAHKGADQRGYRRVFSIASAPSETDVVRFGLRVADRSSSFKTHMLALEPGEIVTATSIGGDFLLPKDPSRPLLMVAGGIGITPYISHLGEVEATGTKRDIVVVYSSSRPDEIAYAERLGMGGHRVLLVSPSVPDELPSNWTYLGAGPLTGEMLLRAVPDAVSRDAYVSGAPQLVTSLKSALRRAGVKRVKSDYFSGY